MKNEAHTGYPFKSGGKDVVKRASKSKEATKFVVSKRQWRRLTGRSAAQFPTCFPISMNGVGMIWEYCCNRCIDWSFKCCIKCGHNQGCENSPYATRRRLPRPISKEAIKARGWG